MNRSAVAIIRAPVNGESCLLMIRRAQRTGDPWSGQMAFPGGRRESSDASLLATAQRETREEVGVDLCGLPAIVCRQSELVTRSHRSWRPQVVTPFLFDLAAPPATTAGEEAERVVWVPVDLFSTPASTLAWPLGPLTLRFPAYHLDDGSIWGLSLMMIRGLSR
jgi:8-oxo-dGTP pyrophosphatase MutT (NUDIX family)